MLRRSHFGNGFAASRRGMTLFEVLIALFIFTIGIVGVLMAIPSGVFTASTVIFQDAAIQLAHSKFAEFRRDRVDPAVDLTNAAYLGPVNSSFNGPWRDFPHDRAVPTDSYSYFDDIERYEWKLDMEPISAGLAGTPTPPPNYFFPNPAGNSNIGLTRVSVIVQMKGTKRQFRFMQYMYAYGRVAPYDNL